mgnify:CR=1 FL=1
MSKPFDMELFLAGVLTGAHATRERHIRQAKVIQAEISKRWRRENPWTWQRKHILWFLDHRIERHAESTRYYYLLTIKLINRRLEQAWKSPADNKYQKTNDKSFQSRKSIR